jgi:aryl-alcohol dehydrogenase-like predicted oxidoreductase
MIYTELGRTGLSVSRLCFGALTVGPLQSNLPLNEGAAVIRYALEQGVNFIDTAKLYGTYPYIREALRGWDKPGLSPANPMIIPGRV